jgi:hypothetical protein
MNPWTQVAMEISKKQRGPLLLRSTPQVLGELPGLGQSHIVVLAWSGSMSVVLVVPSARKKEGWAPQSATTTGRHKSSAGTITFGYFAFEGLWLIPGTAKPQVDRLHFHLGDGSQVDVGVRDGRFLVVREVDPLPFEATVLRADGQVLDHFHLPPERAKVLVHG